MPRSDRSLTLDEAKRMLQAGEDAAAAIGLAYNLAVVDVGSCCAPRVVRRSAEWPPSW